MWGQPGCAWRSMFLCKLQIFQPSLGDSRGHTATLQSTEGAFRAHGCCSVTEGHKEVIILLVKMHWVPSAPGMDSGALIPSSAFVHTRGQENSLDVSILFLPASLNCARLTQASGEKITSLPQGQAAPRCWELTLCCGRDKLSLTPSSLQHTHGTGQSQILKPAHLL